MTNYDTTEKVERTDVGYRLTIESTRGTGTRDQDKVKMEARTESVPHPDHVQELRESVKRTMEDLRGFDPDGDGDD